jgi:hypothetical protein
MKNFVVVSVAMYGGSAVFVLSLRYLQPALADRIDGRWWRGM